MKRNIGQGLAITAATLFMLLTFYWLYWDRYRFSNYEFMIHDLWKIIWLLYAVVLFLKKQKLLLITTGAHFLFLSYTTLLSSNKLSDPIGYYFHMAAVFLLFIYVLFHTFSPGFFKRIRLLWILVVILFLIPMIYNVIFQLSIASISLHVLFYMIITALPFLSLILTTLWLAGKIESQYRVKVNMASSKYGTALKIEKLESLKRLLDIGALTQEEFDEQKKQVLG